MQYNVASQCNMCTTSQIVLYNSKRKDLKKMAANVIKCNTLPVLYIIRECGSTLYVGMARGVSFSLYIGIGAKLENTQKTCERRLRTAEYRTVLV